MSRLLRGGLLALLLTACSAAPLTIPIPDATFPFASVPTGNMVLVQLEPFPLDKPPVGLRSVEIVGQAEYVQTPLTLQIYASASLPVGCAAIPQSPFAICPAASLERVGEISFASGAVQPFRLSGASLAAGVNGGQLWLGAQIAADTPTSGAVRLFSMAAKAAVF